jgi:hypothetical protein
LGLTSNKEDVKDWDNLETQGLNSIKNLANLKKFLNYSPLEPMTPEV